MFLIWEEPDYKNLLGWGGDQLFLERKSVSLSFSQNRGVWGYVSDNKTVTKMVLSSIMPIEEPD